MRPSVSLGMRRCVAGAVYFAYIDGYECYDGLVIPRFMDTVTTLCQTVLNLG